MPGSDRPSIPGQPQGWRGSTNDLIPRFPFVNVASVQKAVVGNVSLRRPPRLRASRPTFSSLPLGPMSASGYRLSLFANDSLYVAETGYADPSPWSKLRCRPQARDPRAPEVLRGQRIRSIKMGPIEEGHPVSFPAIGSGGAICTRLSVTETGNDLGQQTCRRPGGNTAASEPATTEGRIGVSCTTTSTEKMALSPKELVLLRSATR